MAEPVLRYHGITPGVVAFSTTRHGGYSRGNYAEFNINQHYGDAPEDTQRNLCLLCRVYSAENSGNNHGDNCHCRKNFFVKYSFYRF